MARASLWSAPGSAPKSRGAAPPADQSTACWNPLGVKLHPATSPAVFIAIADAPQRMIPRLRGADPSAGHSVGRASPLESALIPTMSPEALMPAASLQSPPRVPRSLAPVNEATVVVVPSLGPDSTRRAPGVVGVSLQPRRTLPPIATASSRRIMTRAARGTKRLTAWVGFTGASPFWCLPRGYRRSPMTSGE